MTLIIRPIVVRVLVGEPSILLEVIRTSMGVFREDNVPSYNSLGMGYF